MNCLYEAIAGVYVRARSKLIPPSDDELGDAEEHLEACRAGLACREAALEKQCEQLAASALVKKAKGDLGAARSAVLERKRVQARLDKVRGGIALLDKQLDALRSSELDKELMNSLKLSSQAMKKAGIGQGLEEAETVMNELDDQIREASELTTVLATPLVNSTGEEDEGIDLDEELGLIEREAGSAADATALTGSKTAAAAALIPQPQQSFSRPNTEKKRPPAEPLVEAEKPSSSSSRLMHLADL